MSGDRPAMRLASHLLPAAVAVSELLAFGIVAVQVEPHRWLLRWREGGIIGVVQGLAELQAAVELMRAKEGSDAAGAPR